MKETETILQQLIEPDSETATMLVLSVKSVSGEWTGVFEATEVVSDLLVGGFEEPDWLRLRCESVLAQAYRCLTWPLARYWTEKKVL